ncbi:NUDIX domain-containing protein [candidate division KSB3 bacterium]|uniref:NUDIX domain-containing protein n=1 Tax=candidate division KSB3 bacterium TaxID=2044937 RepID=A0A9D5Q876_9BACT|nr:NUDIX domain-containing protein [candidate division KSB3 bacterium]MBD3327659.1 NUDIX domain-containing protein [candidate division KSB3 bacterium]
MEPSRLERPVIAVDVVAFMVEHAQLQVLLHQRQEDPFRGAWALPGVAVRIDETLQEAARRALAEKARWPSADQKQLYLDQLATFDALYRDPRGRTISIAYLGIIAQRVEGTDGVAWRPVEEIDPGGLPFDHPAILDTAVTRLRGKLRYTNIAQAFLAETFRIEELQEVYEAILGYPLNRTNFRNKLLKIELIEQVRILNEAVGKHGGRPPHLYRFTHDLLEIVEREFV